MNKVVFTAGVLTVCVVGGLFFCAGLFTGTSVAEKEKTTKIIDAKDNKSLMSKIQGMLPGKKVKETLKTKAEKTTKEVLKKSKEQSVINIDNLLNEIVASHDTNDECLMESVKTKTQEPFTMNQNKRYVVFIGYFPNDVSEEISHLMMAKGYPIHVQSSQINEEESYVFCGPFKKKLNAEKLVAWLHEHNFMNAKLVSHKLLQAEEMDLDEIEGSSKLPQNGDTRKRNVKKKLEDAEDDVHEDEHKVEEEAEVANKEEAEAHSDEEHADEGHSDSENEGEENHEEDHEDSGNDNEDGHASDESREVQSQSQEDSDGDMIQAPQVEEKLVNLEVEE